MAIYGSSLAYLGAHFFVYFFAGRKQPALRTEKGIFLYHACSAGLLLAAVAGYVFWAKPPHALPIVFGIAALHGIYSLSFLELWTLSQISYSRDVIQAVLAGHTAAGNVITRLASVGDQKKLKRLQGLERLGLLSVLTSTGTVQLRGAGVAISSTLRFLRWVTNLRSTG